MAERTHARGSLGSCLTVAWPLVLAMATQAVMMFADRLFLARYSAVSIQAAMPAGLMSFIILAFLQNVVAYSGTFVAQYAGAGARAACARAMGQGVWLAVLCVPVLLLTLPLGNWLFALVGHAPEVVNEEVSYYRMLVFGSLAIPFVAALSGFFTGQGFTRLVMVANVAGNVFNVALDPFLIWGWWGLPELGIAGAGLATALAQYLVLAILVVALCRETHFATRRRRRVAFAWQTQGLLRVMRFGLPSGSHVLLDVGTFAVFVFLTGRLDALSFAASNIAFSINHLVFAPLLGLGMAANILTGQCMGERDVVGARHVGRNCVLLGWGYLVLCTAVILGFNGPILRAFFPAHAPFTYAEFLPLSQKLIVIFLVWALFDTWNIVLGGALKGAGDTHFVMGWVCSVAVFLWMPALFGLYLAGFGIVALWLSIVLYVTLAGCGLLIRFLRGRWETIRMIE